MNLPDCMYDYREDRSPEDRPVPCSKCGEPITYDEAYESLEDGSYICYLCHLKEVDNINGSKGFE